MSIQDKVMKIGLESTFVGNLELDNKVNDLCTTKVSNNEDRKNKDFRQPIRRRLVMFPGMIWLLLWFGIGFPNIREEIKNRERGVYWICQ